MDIGGNQMMFRNDFEMKGVHSRAKSMTSNEDSDGGYYLNSTVDESNSNREEYETVFSKEQNPFSLL